VYAHNIETVERLQRRVRDSRAGYMQSLNVLKAAKVRRREAYVMGAACWSDPGPSLRHAVLV
jgi:lipoate synthase